MAKRWTEAGGEYQLLFMSAASRLIKVDENIECPKCKQSTIRFYFHVFNKNKGTGTIWIWCPNCRTTLHLPRVKPEGLIFPDPFSNLSIEEFAEIEQDTRISFMDRLDKLWNIGKIGNPIKQL